MQELYSKQIKTAVVLSTAVGLNASDHERLLFDALKKKHKVKRGLRDPISIELSLWSWAVTQCLTTITLFSQNRQEEAVIYDKVFRCYLVEVCRNQQEIGGYEGYLRRFQSTVEEARDNFGYDNWFDYVQESMSRFLALAVLRYLKPDIMRMELIELNSVYGEEIGRIRGHIATIYRYLCELVSHYLIESDDNEIHRAFDSVHQEQPVAHILEEVRK